MVINPSEFPGQLSVKMENPSNLKVPATATAGVAKDDGDLQRLQHAFNELSSEVIMLEQKVQEIEHYSSNSKKPHMNLKSKDKGRHLISIKKQQDNPAPSETMKQLMCQFGKIVNQIILRKGVDANDLGLHNCPEVSGTPRDFSAIIRRMDINDGTGYSHVREIYTDVRSILKNAMKYNDEKSKAHGLASSLLVKFEEKWLLLLREVMIEEDRIKEEQLLRQANHARMAKDVSGEEDRIKEEQLLRQANHAQMAKDVSGELFEVEDHLEELKTLVLQKCRRMSTLEKRELGKALTQLSAEDLKQALEIVAQSNPAFQASAEEVDLDIDAQSEYTLRRLKYFILDVFQNREYTLPSIAGYNTNNNDNANMDKPQIPNFKRKREIVEVGGKNAKKKTKKNG